MKLIGMRFQGIGPYQGEYSIDFAALNRSRIFLIEGETGAGKSTILDCISFALYGDVSVDDASKNRLRSRFLDLQDKPSFVDLIFELNGRYYRVKREPAYDRRKKRGEGTVAVNAKGKLWRLDPGFGELLPGETSGETLGETPGETSGETPGGGVVSDGRADRYFTYAEQDEHGELLAAQARDTGAEIIRLLHLSRDQFSKTVMLAQGQFAGFLKCRPEERTQIVKSLFSADVYESIQKTLDEMRKEQAADVSSLRSDLLHSVLTMKSVTMMLEDARDERETRIEDDGVASGGAVASGGVADGDGYGVVDGDGAGCSMPEPKEWALRNGDIAEPALEPKIIETILRSRAAEAKRCADELLTRRSRELDEAQEQAEAAQRRCDGMDRLRVSGANVVEARTKMDELDSLADEYAQRRRTLEKSDEAKPVVRAADDVNGRRADGDARQAELDAVTARLNEIEPEQELNQAREEAVRRAAARPVAERRLDEAQQRRERLKRYEQAADDAKRAEKADAQARDALERIVQELGELESEESVEKAIREAIRVEEQRDLLAERLEQATQRLRYVHQHDQSVERVGALRAALADAQQDRQTAEDEYRQAKEMFFAAGAASYAARLEDGCPCPVCGSSVHPEPAIVPETVIDQERLNVLEQHARQAADAVSQANAAVESELERSASLAVLSDGLNAEEARTAIDELNGKIKDSNDVEERRRALEQQLEHIRAVRRQESESRQHAQSANDQMDAARRLMRSMRELCRDDDGEPYTETSIAELERSAREDIAECERQDALAKTLDERIERRRELTRQAAELQAVLNEIREQIAVKSAELDALLASSGFDDLPAARAAEISDDEHARIAADIKQYDRTVDVAHDRLLQARGEFRKLRDSDEIAKLNLTMFNGQVVTLDEQGTQPEQLESEARQAAALDLTEAHQELADIKARRDHAIRIQERARNLDAERKAADRSMIESLQAWLKASERFVPVRDMALLTAGRPGSLANDGLSLVTFAVTERFRDVLARANDILKDIHGGVYELRLGSHEGRGVKTGLPIEVFDRRSELTTEATTLSGGETFFVSLALSLALADIIQAENGGISMETLFIDEGFGSLSEEYLDDVLAVLRRISRHRDIGVISHVGQLKSQIAERISVARISEDSASTLQVIV
ncbi:AAA domain-containing protein [Bifidobacterium margollesii]|uniref:Nuclease SbcCD subunit C n=1 Tax=Bifidobacterium margollesii TaxID=2020964 RepID=A0A2N5JCH3_9BIFI|nr:SMC family ATPase [Bifidobacterium margollesii]PLS31913.1 AAA domain-containing protein [Bifidobacterium margollesii]